MILLILTIVFSILGAVFATQNTQVVSVALGQYHYNNVPLYMVVLVSILIGIIFSCIAYYVTLFSASLTIRGKDSAITNIKRENNDLAKRLHQLEVENAEIKAKHNEEVVDNKSM